VREVVVRQHRTGRRRAGLAPLVWSFGSRMIDSCAGSRPFELTEF
jgi:hypothetical protein